MSISIQCPKCGVVLNGSNKWCQDHIKKCKGKKPRGQTSIWQ
ncbi:unnamed protein product [marine sediment metagenome]|uniref:Uncharacterized protein n=1 Tax=marine sediment metagenome TaxID=412755 RepID=X1BJK0_9ZZZZ